MTWIRMSRGRRLSTPKHFSKGEGFELAAGDWIEVNTPGGGGYGAPAKRDRERIARDVRRGYLTTKNFRMKKVREKGRMQKNRSPRASVKHR
jgi:N-methylhydantoinase B/oxoprolinase/acetone carboxylase alpha subunit